MLLIVRIIIWSNNFFPLRGYPGMCNLLDGLECGTWVHYAMRDVKDMGNKWVTAA